MRWEVGFSEVGCSSSSVEPFSFCFFKGYRKFVWFRVIARTIDEMSGTVIFIYLFIFITVYAYNQQETRERQGRILLNMRNEAS